MKYLAGELKLLRAEMRGVARVMQELQFWIYNAASTFTKEVRWPLISLK